jgi:hypothetical protein
MDLSLILNVVITLLIFGVVYWAVTQIAALIPGVPAFIVRIIQILLVVGLVIYLIKILGSVAGIAIH